MGENSEHRLTARNPDSIEKSQSESSIQPESLPEPVRGYLYGAEGTFNDSSDHPPMCAFGRRTKLTEEERTSLAKLQARIRMYNRTVPKLRIQIPNHNISLNLAICADYYFKCQHASFEKDGASKVAELLTSFSEQHPLEWSFSDWKNDEIAKLVLGELNTTSSARKEPGERWLKTYWKLEHKRQRETDIYLSPKRMAASSAVFELELLELGDENPEFWILPRFRAYAAFVNWLNRNWNRVADRKRGAALLNWLVSEFSGKRRDLAFSDSDLSAICGVYQSIESSHPPGKVPTSQVVLTLVARKHGVSPRLVTKVRAEINKQRLADQANEKARS
jgi:hypothetical protein